MTCPNEGRDCPHCLQASRNALRNVFPYILALALIALAAVVGRML